MRTALVLLVLLLLMSSLPVPAPAQQMATSYKPTEVVPGIYMIEGVGGFGGGNVGLLVGPEKIVLIDDTMQPTAPILLEAVREITERPVDFLINTHVHGDHVGGNAMLAESGAVIVAHDNIRKRLAEDSSPAGGEAGLPVLTFNDTVTLHVNGLEVHVFHVDNAHTDGDGIVHFPGVNVVHAGDVMFHDMFPFIDLDNGGSVDGYIAAQDRLLGMVDDETIIIPGHGALAKRAELQKDRDVLVDCRDRVRRLVGEGLSEDEIVAANPLADHEARSWEFITTERMTRTLVKSLASGS